MKEQIDGWIDRRMNRQMDGQIYVWIDRYLFGQIDGYVYNRCIAKCKERLMRR